jgi:hypothetical protein
MGIRRRISEPNHTRGLSRGQATCGGKGVWAACALGRLAMNGAHHDKSDDSAATQKGNSLATPVNLSAGAHAERGATIGTQKENAS